MLQQPREKQEEKRLVPDPSTTVSYTYTAATAELKWRSFTGTGWWRDAGGRASFCVGRSKCDKSPKSIL